MPFLILARHGETEINVANETRKIYYGRQESPLTEKGRAQARLLGRDMRERGLVPDLLVSSPIQRTVETARLAVAELPCGPRMLLSDGLTARSLGLFEGRSRDDLLREHPAYVHDPRFNRFDGDFVQRAPGGENLSDVTHRSWSAVEDARRLCDGDILIVTHATVVRCLLGKVLGLEPADVPRLKIPNAAPVYLAAGEDGYGLAFASLQPVVIPGEGRRLAVAQDPLRSRLSA